MLAVRLAGDDDALEMLRWRNDPLTRAMSRNQAPLDEAAHRAWLAGALGDRRRLLLIGMDDRRPAGMLRFDWRDDRQWEVSIALAPEARGRGMGKGLLKLALEHFFSTHGGAAVLAEVRPDNLPSRRLFLSAGFVAAGEADGNAQYVLAGLPAWPD